MQCAGDFGLDGWFGSLFFFLEWQWPAVNNYLRATNFGPVSWILDPRFVDDALQKFTFDGHPSTDATRCFYYTMFNLLPVMLVTTMLFLTVVLLPLPRMLMFALTVFADIIGFVLQIIAVIFELSVELLTLTILTLRNKLDPTMRRPTRVNGRED